MSNELTRNYFELFALPEQFELDRAALDARYRELQRSVHPDRFASAGDQQRRLSMQLAARINEGYRVLKDPLARGRYLLELRGLESIDEQATHQDAAFLMEQMELREALEAVRDSADPFAALNELLARIQAGSEAQTARLAALFAEQPEGVPEAALETLQRMQFFRKLEQEAEELEAELEDL
ncbi:Fe-S protein assembly co-chaperone HscB [Thiohalobacter sp. IOR34]|uniref:Fe-S protein assembly co-chaperone HscB n=1 Tax=Thiohalobacter sp. IOR34 TaxID=3057176 RepID=UPI0025AED899|nr:Fe-S protein assembly co-chaperone HscB [Thiohalobacter sp. IOR34]WJW76259.1 Fe-S protein assembly co-chaperone HscB [Thiohalobacter sp. IOR34]